MISFFVSSTFKDMQQERNLIRFKVLPKINEFLKDYGETADFIDLRWGIDTTEYLCDTDDKQEEANKKVLRVCLEEISKTPYFIGIIGNRYGWVPDEDDVNQVIENMNIKNGTDYTKPDKNISATHLEIDYGAFFRNHPENCFFYIRQILDEKDNDLFSLEGVKTGRYYPEDEKINDLYFPKNKEEADNIANLIIDISEKYEEKRVKFYNSRIDEETGRITDIDDLAESIIEDVKSIIIRDFEKIEVSSWQQREQRDIEYIIDKKSNNFSEQKEILDKIDDFIVNDSKKDILLITGEAGSGKSAISSQLYKIYKDKYVVIPFFMDNTANSSCALDILKYQIYQIYKLLGIDKNSVFKEYINSNNLYLTAVYSEKVNKIIGYKKTTYNVEPDSKILQEILLENLRTYSKTTDKKIIFIIDAIDQMKQDEESLDYKWLIDTKDTNVKYILTCLEDTYFSENALATMEKTKLKLLDKEAVRRILDNNNEKSTYKLSKAVLDRISKNESTNNFLYLSFVLQRFKMFCNYDYEMIKKFGNDMDAINKHMIDIIEHFPKDINYMCIQVLEYAADVFNSNIFDDVIGLIAASRYGLSIQDIGNIFTKNNIDWNLAKLKEIFDFLDTFFVIKEDGKVNFSHRYIKEAIIEEYKNRHFSLTKMSYKEVILDYLLSLQLENPLYSEEIMFYLWQEKRIDKVFDVIENVCVPVNEKCIKNVVDELWKIYRVDNDWLNSIQQYVLLNITDKQKLDVYFYFITSKFMNFRNNTYDEQIYLELLDDLEVVLLDDRIKDLNKGLYEQKETFLIAIWDTKQIIASNVDIKIQSINNIIEVIKSKHIEGYTINNVEYGLNEKSLNLKRINLVSRENKNWHKEKIKWFDELDEDKYMDLYSNKARTYYWMNDLENYDKFMKKELEKVKNNLAQEKNYENYERYLNLLFNYYTYFYEKPLKLENEEDINKLKELVELSEEILTYEKEKFENKEVDIELAKAYMLVAKMYAQLIYIKEKVKTGTKTSTTWKHEGKEDLQDDIYVTVYSLYTYDLKNAIKYYDFAKDILKQILDRKKADNECDRLLNEVEIEKTSAIQDAKIEDRVKFRDITKTDDKYDLYKIEELRNRVKQTLKYEDFMNYYNILPKINSVYKNEKYEDENLLREIYVNAINTASLIDYALYSKEEIENLENSTKNIIIRYHNIDIYINGINYDKMEKLIDILEDEREILEYFKYQFINSKCVEGKIECLTHISKYIKGQEEKIRKEKNEDEVSDSIVHLYNLKREALLKLAEEDSKKIDNLDPFVLLLNEVIEDDVYLVNEVLSSFELLTNGIKDETMYINHQVKVYKKTYDEDILQDIYSHQKYILNDYDQTLKQMPLEFMYKDAIKMAESIIKYQSNNKFVDNVENYSKLLEKWKEEVKNLK